jgi:hypothetical protein
MGWLYSVVFYVSLLPLYTFLSIRVSYGRDEGLFISLSVLVYWVVLCGGLLWLVTSLGMIVILVRGFLMS